MKYPLENNVKKLGAISRVLAAFILLCSLIGAAGIVFAIINEPFNPVMLAAILVIGLMLHISGSITFKRYAPKYLLFTHGQK